MRDIRFRGKSAGSGEWVKGTLVPGGDGSCYILETPCSKSVKVRPDTVGQWTGRHDRNRDVLYEGDMVRLDDGKIGIVKWSDADACYRIDFIGDMGRARLYEYLPDDMEIVGNAHDDIAGRGDLAEWAVEKMRSVMGGKDEPLTKADIPMLMAAIGSGEEPR